MIHFLISLLPFWVVRKLYQFYPPTCNFKTTTGRVFRVVAVNNDFLIATSSEKYDAKVAEKLVKMQQEGEKLVQTAIDGMNALSFDEREHAARLRYRKEVEDDRRK